MSTVRPKSTKQKIKDYLLPRIGEVVTAHQLRDAAAPATEWARRLRELRTDEGWPIASHLDDESLRPGEYLLTAEPPPPGEYRFSRQISGALRAQVLERNGYTCQMCGTGAGERYDDDPTRKARLQIGHSVDHVHHGPATPGNLRALCARCNQGAKNLVPEPPRWIWLLSQIRRASRDDQRKALQWLRSKFRDDQGP